MATTTMSEVKAPDTLMQQEESSGTGDDVGSEMKPRRKIGTRPA
jgi:hypothetical protein